MWTARCKKGGRSRACPPPSLFIRGLLLIILIVWVVRILFLLGVLRVLCFLRRFLCRVTGFLFGFAFGLALRFLCFPFGLSLCFLFLAEFACIHNRRLGRI